MIVIEKFRVKSKGRKPWVYSIHDEVIVKYVNIYNGTDTYHDMMGYLKVPLSGPQKVPHLYKTKSIKSFIRKHRQLQTNIQKTKSVTTIVDTCPNSVLHYLLRTNLNLEKGKSESRTGIKIMSNKGSLLVIIEGPIGSLGAYTNLQWERKTNTETKLSLRKPFLIPFIEDSLKGKMKSKFSLRYHVRKDPNPLSKTPCCSEHVNDFDQECRTDEEFVRPISTTCYDLSILKHGLIFAFRKNESLEKPMVVNELSLRVDMQPSEIYNVYNGAVVLSEWFKHKDFYSVEEDGIRLVHKCHGDKGFGSRSRSSCVGTNVYHGERQKRGTVGNPL